MSEAPDLSARLKRWVAPHVPALHAYVPGTQPTGSGWVKLNTNELPYPPSERVGEAIAAEIPLLAKYPNPSSAPLRAALAAYHRVAPEQVFVGNGSDEVLALLVRLFAGPERPIGMLDPSYSLYPVLAQIEAAETVRVPFAPGLRLPLEGLAALDLPLFFLTTPNAPFGVGFSPKELEAAVAGFGGIFVADEAYADFGDVSAVPLLAKYPHLVVTRTFSKTHGLAGLRVGYALADASVVALLDRVRDSYNVNRASQAGALAALADRAWLGQTVGRVRATRERFAAAFQVLGWTVLPSQANFVFARPPAAEGAGGAERAAAAYQFLEARKILVRYFPGSPLTANGLRISIGTDPEMDRCLEAIEAWQTQTPA